MCCITSSRNLAPQKSSALGPITPPAVLLLQSPSASMSEQQLPTPFARQGSQNMEHTGIQGPSLAAEGIPRHDEGQGAFSRAASLPVAALARSASGQHEDTLRLGKCLFPDNGQSVTGFSKHLLTSKHGHLHRGLSSGMALVFGTTSSGTGVSCAVMQVARAQCNVVLSELLLSQGRCTQRPASQAVQCRQG